jgi:vacuolar-type H+-ATPase subunit E/Vma4
MALDALLESLTRDAVAEAEALLSRARDDAARLRNESMARAARRCDDAVARRAAELREGAEVARAEATRAARTRVLEARARLLQRLRVAITTQLDRALDSPNAATLRVLARLLAEGAHFLPDGALIIARCSMALVEPVRVAAAAFPSVRVIGDTTVGPGVVVQSEDGALVVDNTLPARLDRLWPELAIGLMAGLGERA